MTLLRRLAEPYNHMSFYLCSEAIEQFNKLPPNHFNTGWVLSNIGRCYMEVINIIHFLFYNMNGFNLDLYFYKQIS